MLDQADFTVVIPMLNEEKNIPPLIEEIYRERAHLGDFEVILVDDHSTDCSYEIARNLADEINWLHVIRLRRQSGQSAALHYGIMRAKHPLIVTMDGDGQNDPADIKQLVEQYQQHTTSSSPVLINGYRSIRKDTSWCCFSSLVANRTRKIVLRDGTPDSGCGIKVFSKETYNLLPTFNHMHRFFPALIQQQGGTTLSVTVNHRERGAGGSHYGTLDRLKSGLIDLIGMMWLAKRTIPQGLVEEGAHEQ